MDGEAPRGLNHAVQRMGGTGLERVTPSLSRRGRAFAPVHTRSLTRLVTGVAPRRTEPVPNGNERQVSPLFPPASLM